MKRTDLSNWREAICRSVLRRIPRNDTYIFRSVFLSSFSDIVRMSLCYNKVSLVFLILSLLNTLKQRKQSNMKLKQIYVRRHGIAHSIVSARGSLGSKQVVINSCSGESLPLR